MNREREVLLEMIEVRENQVRVDHRQIDALYERYDWKAKYAGVDTLHEKISDLYAEILLLKTVLMAAEERE